MSRARLFLAAATIGAALAAAGCSSSQPEQAEAAPAVTVTVTPTVTPTPTPEAPSEAPVSDIQVAVDTFVGALDRLGIEHSEPVRAEVGASGAKARFDITINGYEAGINVFPDADTLAAWGKLSDAYGGIFVSSGTAALSLNSSEGVGNSAEIAPAIADAVNGETRGV
ncbi:hypothetical protein M3667_03255 [Microbacterium sp. P26]|uniref:hypothetical protein n=1 Tax=Microbacterium sp. P26 TaxID=2939565 RepID=UPI00203AB160|nr:hypothetical protein [Microbacterium sp. P26]MCM3500895.1 hypothetical protein [Microbacterium sp. P26]